MALKKSASFHLKVDSMICGCTTYCPLVQESGVELHKLLLGLFCIEVLEELGVKVAQLAAEERKERNKSPVWQHLNSQSCLFS